jgi:regulator of protease activity HflC (stomatin/prohibitin superfamily)
MFTTILLAVLILTIIVGVIVWGRIDASQSADHELTKKVVGWSTVGVGVLTAALLIFSTLVIVPTREVGIKLTFAKPVGTLSNGLHVKAPWQSVEHMDAAIQTDNHVKDGGETSDGSHSLSCVTTRIAHQAVACVDVTIRWRIIDDQAAQLFQNYRTFGNVRDSLVTRDLNSAVNATMETYDVLSVDENGQATAPELSEVAKSVMEEMNAQIGDQIEVLQVIIPVVHFDDATQSRVNALQSQIAQTRIAEQAERTAIAQAKANKELAASVSNDPNVLVSKCLDLLNESITKGYPLPAGFSCWGASSAIVVPSAKS